MPPPPRKRRRQRRVREGARLPRRRRRSRPPPKPFPETVSGKRDSFPSPPTPARAPRGEACAACASWSSGSAPCTRRASVCAAARGAASFVEKAAQARDAGFRVSRLALPATSSRGRRSRGGSRAAAASPAEASSAVSHLRASRRKNTRDRACSGRRRPRATAGRAKAAFRGFFSRSPPPARAERPTRRTKAPRFRSAIVSRGTCRARAGAAADWPARPPGS